MGSDGVFDNLCADPAGCSGSTENLLVVPAGCMVYLEFKVRVTGDESSTESSTVVLLISNDFYCISFCL